MRIKRNITMSAGQKTGIDRFLSILYNMKVLRDLCDFETPRPFSVVRKGSWWWIQRGEKYFSPLFSYKLFYMYIKGYEIYCLFEG